jgi:hypothetical protein
MAKQNKELSVYMTAIERDRLLDVVGKIQPRNVLEWGSGGSTKLLLDSFPCISTFVSVEHDPKWFARVRCAIQNDRLLLYLVQPDYPKPADMSRDRWRKLAEYDESVMRSYVGQPCTTGLDFQFILIDGRARRFCLREGYRLLAEGGTMLLHDAQRHEYQDVLQSFANIVSNVTFLTDTRFALIRKY